jgi:hypothetical protein
MSAWLLVKFESRKNMKAKYLLAILVIIVTVFCSCSKKQSDKTSQTPQSPSDQTKAVVIDANKPAGQNITDINSGDAKMKRAVEKTIESKQSQRRPR